ncbi:hypothetical protein ACFL3F_02790 [Planctomycetota bacterium]
MECNTNRKRGHTLAKRPSVFGDAFKRPLVAHDWNFQRRGRERPTVVILVLRAYRQDFRITQATE